LPTSSRPKRRRLVGKIIKITDGTITLATNYAGEIAIKQSEVTSLTTDDAVALRLASGTRIDGRVSTSAGKLQVAGKEGTVSTTIDKVAASWIAGAEDPQIVAARRHWTIETTADITGRQGNTESTGIGAGFVARLVSPHDVLKFYGSYDYATTTSATGVKTKSADATKAESITRVSIPRSSAGSSAANSGRIPLRASICAARPTPAPASG